MFELGVPRLVQNGLYVAIWRAISSYPNFKNIKIIRFSSNKLREPRDPLGDDPYKTFSLKLSPEAKEFLGLVAISDEELGNEISIPKQHFETVKIEAYDFKLQCQPGFSSRPFFFGNSTETLKSINLCMSGLLTIVGSDHSPITIRFPNVTKTKLHGKFNHFRGDYTSGMVAKWFAQACPNVESCKFWILRSYNRGLLTREYEEFIPMHKLKVLEIPWPRHPLEEMASTIKRFNQKELTKFIRDLMNAGLESLENVTFIRMPIWAALWDELIFRECRIDRCDKERGPRIWWKRSYRYHDINIRRLTPDQTEFDEGDANDSGDDLDEYPPQGAEVSRFWVHQTGHHRALLHR
ncbi:hypothetical protein TWF788_003453 [Orbilia oligospora]|uniref:Uncharacterized protein n=1 Tax=Orbilia oligospora TaxID=2813651 RepID=A0A7C8KC95_ORBOL|nr:hypothetical protein TWF788_003453 [Orbilia oligospora]